MEIREVQGLPIGFYHDSIIGFTYCRFLTFEGVESIKMTRGLEKLSYGHLMRPDYLVTLELKKTRKNWIVSDVLNYIPIHQQTDYSEISKYSQMIHLLQKHTRVGQEIDLLSWFTVQVNYGIHQVNMRDFEVRLLHSLGFGGLSPEYHG